jgi:transposase
MLDRIEIEPGAYYVLDRGYLDFKRLYRFTLGSAFFVTRSKKNVLLQRRYSHPVDKSTGVSSDQTVILTSFASASDYPDALRRVSYRDPATGKRLRFLTNNFTLPALTIAEIYKQRWQVELFFKWIKQHLRIKAFFGTGENAVKTQIWIAISVYVLVAVVRKRLKLDSTLYQILQILSLISFEKTPVLQALQSYNSQSDLDKFSNQMILFDLWPDSSGVRSRIVRRRNHQGRCRLCWCSYRIHWASGQRPRFHADRHRIRGRNDARPGEDNLPNDS